MNHSRQRIERIKMARAVLNIHEINNELKKFNLPGLQKSAAVGAHRKQRLKYAALVRQRELEKQAFINGLARLGIKGMGMLARGFQQAGQRF